MHFAMRPQQVRSRFNRIFLPVLLIIIISILFVSFISTHYFSEMLEKYIYRNHVSTLSMISSFYSEMRFNTIPLANQLFNDETIQNYLFARNEKWEDSLRAQKVIEDTVSTSNYLHSIYLYNARYGYLSTTDGLEGHLMASDPMLEAFLASDPKPMDINLRRVPFSSDEKATNVFTVVRYRYHPGTHLLDYALILNISNSMNHTNIDRSIPESFRNFYIVDDQHRFIVSPDETEFGARYAESSLFTDIMQQKALQGTFLCKSGKPKESYVVCWADQPEIQWRLMYLVPYSEVLETIGQIRRRAIAISLIVLVLAIVFLFLVSRHVNKLMDFEQRLMAYIGGSGKLGTTPFTIDQLFSISVFRTDRKRTSRQVIARERLDTFEFAKLGITPTRDYLLRLDAVHVCWLTFHSPIRTKQKLDRLSHDLAQTFHTDLTAIYTHEQVQLEDIPHEVQLQKKILANVFLASRGTIHDDCMSFDLDRNLAPISIADFEHAFRSNNSSQFRRETDAVISQLFGRINYEYFLSVCVRMAFIIHHFACPTLDLLLPQGIAGWYEQTVACKELSEMQRMFHQIADTMDQCSASLPNEHQSKIVEQVKHYIRTNIRDKNLNAAIIADQMHLSINYLRVIFKQNGGHSINETIGLLRIEMATKLLKETTRSVADIKEEVGFGNYSYFCTYFKNIMGMTPSQYRSSV